MKVTMGKDYLITLVSFVVQEFSLGRRNDSGAHFAIGLLEFAICHSINRCAFRHCTPRDRDLP